MVSVARDAPVVRAEWAEWAEWDAPVASVVSVVLAVQVLPESDVRVPESDARVPESDARVQELAELGAPAELASAETLASAAE